MSAVETCRTAALGGHVAVLAYLSRFTHRVAISNHRLIRVDANTVAFRCKDKHGERMKVMCLTTNEFIRRFLISILPSGFHRIRHNCFLANYCPAGDLQSKSAERGIRRDRISMIRRLLDTMPEPEQMRDKDRIDDPADPNILQSCPKCGGAVIAIETFKRGQTPKSRTPPREDAA